METRPPLSILWHSPIDVCRGRSFEARQSTSEAISDEEIEMAETGIDYESGKSPEDPGNGAHANWRSLRNLIGVAFGIACCAVLVILITEARRDARMAQSRNNLKQLGLAIHNYHDNFNVLPPGAIFNDEGTGFFGWGFQLLPYLDSSPLYSHVDQHVPWNTSRNAKLFRQPCHSWQSPLAAEATDSQGFTVTHYSANSHLFYRNSSTKLRDIEDGLKFTIMVGEIASGFPPYAAPGNWRDPALGIHYDEKTFGRPTRDGVSFLMADGAIRDISDRISPDVLRALSTPAGGEEVGERDLSER